MIHVDTRDVKSLDFVHAGSIPAGRTTLNICMGAKPYLYSITGRSYSRVKVKQLTKDTVFNGSDGFYWSLFDAPEGRIYTATDVLTDRAWQHLADTPQALLHIDYEAEWITARDAAFLTSVLRHKKVAPSQLCIVLQDLIQRNYLVGRCAELEGSQFYILNRHVSETARSYHAAKKTRDQITEHKRITVLNRRHDSWRFKLILELSRRGCLDQCHWSYQAMCTDRGIPHRRSKLIALARQLDYKDQTALVKTQIPKLLDQFDRASNQNHPVLYSAISNSDISLIPESLFDRAMIREEITSCPEEKVQGQLAAGDISEKTYKSIAVGKPFVLFGQTGALRCLRSLGYKTFSPWIDESYDDIADDQQRFLKICDIVEKILSLDHQQHAAMLKRCQSNVEFNKELFFQHVHDYNQVSRRWPGVYGWHM